MARVAQISHINRARHSVSENEDLPPPRRVRFTDGEDHPDREAHHEARHQRDRSIERTPSDDEGDVSKIGKAWQRSARNPLSAMESRNQNLVRRVVANLKTTKAKKRWRYVMEGEDLADEYVVK